MKDYKEFTSAEKAEFIEGRDSIVDDFDDIEDIIEYYVDMAFEKDPANIHGVSDADIAAKVWISPEWVTEHIIDKVEFIDEDDSEFRVRGMCVGWNIRVEEHFDYHFGGNE